MSQEEVFISRDYRKIRQIGRGGEGTVYLVFHVPTGQLRAAKCFRNEHSHRQLQELVLIKQLSHPALPQVFDILTYEGRQWLIMEYIRGRSIAEFPRAARTEDQFFSVAGQLAEVLSYLHTRPSPVLHLDIKPSNVLLRADGRLVLIDFGAAILASKGGEEGNYGTPGFAAPEQKQQESRVDVRADIYGFGALLYFYLHGEIPAETHEKRTGRKKTDRNPVIGRIVERCMRAEPEERFPDFAAVRESLIRAQRRCHKKRQLRKSIGATWLLGAALLFAGTHLNLIKNEAFSAAADRKNKKNYEALLERSETLGLGQAAACYEKALQLFPERNGWFFLLLDRVEQDYVFDEDEEEAVKQLIYTVPEGESRTFLELQKEENSLTYREMSYRLGMLYWYFYDKAGGKSAAAKWFTEAVGNEPRGGPPWIESARLHADISSYYEKLGKKDENGKTGASYSTYWQDLKQLWALDVLKENLMIRLYVADELLGCMLFHMQEIYESGEIKEGAEDVCNSLKTFFAATARETGAETSEEEKRIKQCKEAESAIERIYGRKGGITFEES